MEVLRTSLLGIAKPLCLIQKHSQDKNKRNEKILYSVLCDFLPKCLWTV